MYALLIVATFTADPTIYLLEEHGEVEFRVPTPGGGEQVVVVMYDGDLRTLRGFAGVTLKYPFEVKHNEIPADLKPSTRIDKPVITRKPKYVSIRFPSQWFGKNDVRFDIPDAKDAKAAVITTVVKLETEYLPITVSKE